MAVEREKQPDLTACEREPVLRQDLIQAFGFLIAVSNDWIVTRASANVGEFLGVSPTELIGTSFQQLISDQSLHHIRNRMSVLYMTGSERIYGLRLLPRRKTAFDLSLHYADGQLVIEGERSQAEGGMEAASMVRAMIARLGSAGSLDAFHDEAARQLRAITGFDRVSIYRSNGSGPGEVMAMSVRAGVDSSLGPHDPTSDIQVDAHELYKRNQFRIIADVDLDPISIEPDPGGQTLEMDLSLAVTRAASPAYLGYLRNMGVSASLSVPIVVDGQPWGLIACHHRRARLPSFVIRTAADLFGQMYSLSLESRLNRDEVLGGKPLLSALRRALKRSSSQLMPAGPAMAEVVRGPAREQSTDRRAR